MSALLEVRNLKKHFPVRKGFFNRKVGEVKAVDDVSFDVGLGETLGLVGESGCGKSTTGRVVLRLVPASGGEVNLESRNLLAMSPEQFFAEKRKLQMVFQDPSASLDPRMTVAQIIGEPLEAHGLVKNSQERDDKVVEIMESVGLRPEHLRRFPFEFSGGQRQRIGIARAVAPRPQLIVADEPVSALDVSIQAQVINLMMDLREKYKLTYLFISHDLSVVHHISDRVAVMYLGRIVEIADKNALFDSPLHPYTQALLSAIPQPDPKRKSQRIILSGDVPSPLNPPQGCHFNPRCPKAEEICRREIPALREISQKHSAACHFA